MMKSAWMGSLLALGIVACGDDTGGAGGGSGGGSSSSGDAATGGSPTSSSAGTPTSSSSGGSPTSSGSGGDPTGGGGDPTGGGGDPTGGGGDPTGGGGDPSGGGGAGGAPGFVASIVDCGGLEPDVEIGTSGFAYAPEAVTIPVGGTVRFTPTGFHDIDSVDGLWDDTALGEVTCLQFDVAGSYGTICEAHLFEGTIVVE